MEAAAILLGLTAVGGVVMAIQRWRGAPRPPHWLAMAHGLLAAVGLTLLAYEAVTVGVPAWALMALALFLFASMLGIALNLRYHVRERALPKSWIIIHLLVAVAGYALLLTALFATPGPRVDGALLAPPHHALERRASA